MLRVDEHLPWSPLKSHPLRSAGRHVDADPVISQLSTEYTPVRLVYADQCRPRASDINVKLVYCLEPPCWLCTNPLKACQVTLNATSRESSAIIRMLKWPRIWLLMILTYVCRADGRRVPPPYRVCLWMKQPVRKGRLVLPKRRTRENIRLHAPDIGPRSRSDARRLTFTGPRFLPKLP